MQHQRGLQDSSVLDIPAQETIWEDLLQGILIYKIPVRHQDATTTQSSVNRLLHRQIESFVDELIVLKVPIEDDNIFKPLTQKRAGNVFDHAHQGGGTQARGPHPMVTATGTRL